MWLRSKRLTYTWYLDGSPIAMGMRPNIKLITGEHTVTLVVSNGREDSEPSQVAITVIDPIEVECRIFPPNKKMFKKKPEIMATLYMPPGITQDEINLDQPLRLYPGGAQVLDHYAIQWRRHKAPCARVFAFFHRDVVIHSVPKSGFMELAITGRLKSGQYFYGSDTINVADLIGTKVSKKRTVHA